ncbi:hypothetical protein [Aestuariibaculum suncheonense]|uniref:SGNH hydrolase-type esterase domain-containing protein n=1 Tax=Aestuariibaculum suncheonense TaxID=1028745 RepID=A0A8J6QSI5_9FLAO|nr:hypothetical protein [Aestuariibaculum suncheonense]MBD0835119.1 hypothetical protein [Aestuariibaculum suncheonense]
MKKQTLFKVISILLPLVFILLFEIILRIGGYGEDYKLFHKVSTQSETDYLVMNKHIAKKYFKDNELQADNQSDLFLKTKTDSTFRIFVQGASTVVGFPYYRGGSFPRMLKHRLSQTFPNKNIEVINTGITAVNSYTLWDFTNAIIEQEPDLVIIYAGHNEYYGALGVGSSITYGSHPNLIRTYLYLKQFRFFQFLENTYYKISSSHNPKPSERETTLMEVMAKEQRIPFNSKIYQEGLKQYESNLNSILSTYQNHNIPVIISTLVSNEKDIKPFISDSIPNKQAFLEALSKDNMKSNKIAEQNALAAYTLGQHYLEKNQDSAKKYLHVAKELDLLRFRAPEKINTIIKSLSKKYHATLIDMKSIFESHSPFNSIGNELLTEHVHPNVMGQFLMADGFYNKIKELKLLKNWNDEIKYDEAIANIPVSEIDSIVGELTITDLKSSWPYNLNMSGKRPPLNYIESTSFEIQMAQNIHKKISNWDQIMAYAYRSYENDKKYEKALRIAQSLIFEYPEQSKVYQMAGEMCFKMQDFEKAAYYFSIFNYLDKSIISAEQLSSTYVKLNKIDLAKQTLLEAHKNALKVKKPINELNLE